jgi:hypothetical protein
MVPPAAAGERGVAVDEEESVHAGARHGDGLVRERRVEAARRERGREHLGPPVPRAVRYRALGAVPAPLHVCRAADRAPA